MFGLFDSCANPRRRRWGAGQRGCIGAIDGDCWQKHHHYQHNSQTKSICIFLNGHFISYCIGSQYKDILIMLEIFTMEKSTQSSQYFSTTRMSIAGEDWDAGANILQSLNQAQVR